MSEQKSVSRMRAERVRSEVLAVAGRVEILFRDFEDAPAARRLLQAALGALREVALIDPSPEPSARRRLVGEHTREGIRRMEVNRGDGWRR